MKRCVIMRGCPGSGKSTEATRIYNEAIEKGFTAAIHSTDNYFIVEGVYVYDQNKIAQNHRANQKAARASMLSGVNVVIIDNTNTTAKEIYPYLEMAFDHDYDIEFVDPRSPWWLSALVTLRGKRSEDRLRPHAKVFAKRNTHNVPEHVILKMLIRYQTDITVDQVMMAGTG